MTKSEDDLCRVYNPCAHKIRNVGSLYSFIEESLQSSTNTAAISTPVKTNPAKKRLLSTPEGKSQARKSVRVLSPNINKENKGKSSRRTLTFDSNQAHKSSEDNLDQNLNINCFPESGLQVKVVFQTESGNVLVIIPREEDSKRLVRQISEKKWHAAANTLMKQSELHSQVVEAVSRNAANEIAAYVKSKSVLLSQKPDEITGFSNRIFLEELRVFFVHCSIT